MRADGDVRAEFTGFAFNFIKREKQFSVLFIQTISRDVDYRFLLPKSLLLQAVDRIFLGNMSNKINPDRESGLPRLVVVSIAIRYTMPTSILVINPNSSKSVTDGLEEALRAPPETTLAFYTAPADAPNAINDATTGTLSAAACFRDLVEKGLIDQYDGFLVSCCESYILCHGPEDD